MDDLCRTFIADAGWADATAQPIAGDLSARRYTRLMRPDGQTAILMDARDEDSTPRFVRITHWLRSIEISAPEILADHSAAGLLLLEDLGAEKPKALLTDPDMCATCLALLLHLRKAEPLPGLPCPGATELADWTSLAEDHYPEAEKPSLRAFRAYLETILQEIMTGPRTPSLRDFHVENLLWLPDRDGIRRLGVLDYQDAFVTHPVYDLVSLLTDARHEVPTALRRQVLASYAKLSGDNPDSLSLAFAAFSAQRNLRILGIFARAASRDGKTHHLDKIPRVRTYLLEALSHPMLAGHRDAVAKALPL